MALLNILDTAQEMGKIHTLGIASGLSVLHMGAKRLDDVVGILGEIRIILCTLKELAIGDLEISDLGELEHGLRPFIHIRHVIRHGDRHIFIIRKSFPRPWKWRLNMWHHSLVGDIRISSAARCSRGIQTWLRHIVPTFQIEITLALWAIGHGAGLFSSLLQEIIGIDCERLPTNRIENHLGQPLRLSIGNGTGKQTTGHMHFGLTKRPLHRAGHRSHTLVLGGFHVATLWIGSHVTETAWQGKKADANRFSNLHHALQRLAVFGWLCLIIHTIPNLSIHYTLFPIRLISGGYTQIHWNPTCSAERLILAKRDCGKLRNPRLLSLGDQKRNILLFGKLLAQESHKEAWFLLWVLSNNQRPYASCLPRTEWCFVSAWFLLQWHSRSATFFLQKRPVNNSFWWWHRKNLWNLSPTCFMFGGHLTELSGADISQCFFHECLEKFYCIQTILTR